jgi:hypothetical protein
MTHDNYLIPEWNSQLRAGMKKLAHSMRTRIFRRLPAFYSKLDEADDAVFLEPLLFAYFSGLLPDTISLEQLLAGSITNPGNSEHIRVCSDEDGIIYLPSLGYLKTGLAKEMFTLIWDQDLHCYELKLYGVPAVFDFALLNYDRISGIELGSNICRLSGPLFEEEMSRDGLCFEKGMAPVFPMQDAIVNTWKPQLGSTFVLLGRICPDYLDQIKSVIRKIVFFECNELPSFAPSGLSGCVYLNCWEANSEVAFIAGITACTAGLQFNLLTQDRNGFFRTHPEELCLNGYPKCKNSKRTIWQAMKELFISTSLTAVLESCYRSKLFSGPVQQELAGRLAHNRDKYEGYLDAFEQKELLTDQGIAFYREMTIQRAEIYASLEEALAGIRVHNHSLLFNWKLFKQMNPVNGDFEFA